MTTSILRQDLLESAVTALPRDKLSAIREAALASFAANGLPTTKHEDWKYTNLSSVADLGNSWLTDTAARATAKNVETVVASAIDAHWIVIENGVVNPELLGNQGSWKRSGISLSSLTEGVDETSLVIDDPMSAFNAALLRDGLHLKVAAGASLEKPLGILLIDDGSVALTQARLLIEVGEDATLQIVECPLSAGDQQQFANSVTQAVLHDRAKLDFVRIQQRQKDHLSVNRFKAELGRDAVLDYNNFEFGGGLARNDIIADITAPGATVDLRGLYLASGHQHIDNHTRVDHRVGPATSNEEYRGILTGRARCVFNGKVVVHDDADGTDADQSNHNLLLSDRAEIDTKPELEIYADDVKCSHGATVGQLDKSAMFYLRSRGLDKDEATQVLTRAFASTILSKLAIGACHDYLATALDEQLDALIDEE